MASNPARSPWRSTPRAKRKRAELSITISVKAREALEKMAPDGTRSAFVEHLILAEAERRGWLEKKDTEDT